MERTKRIHTLVLRTSSHPEMPMADAIPLPGYLSRPSRPCPACHGGVLLGEGSQTNISEADKQQISHYSPNSGGRSRQEYHWHVMSWWHCHSPSSCIVHDAEKIRVQRICLFKLRPRALCTPRILKSLCGARRTLTVVEEAGAKHTIATPYSRYGMSPFNQNRHHLLPIVPPSCLCSLCPRSLLCYL